MESLGRDKTVTFEEKCGLEVADIAQLIQEADMAQSAGRFDDAVAALEAIYAEFDRRAAQYPL
jgi:hypothetical protein